MRIKTFQKWFICCFAIIFVAVFFVYDCMFFNVNNNFADEIVVEDFLEEEVIEELDKEIQDVQTKEDEVEQEKPEQIPIYTNGYKCLLEAYDRIAKASSYKTTMVGKCYSTGVTQSVKCIKQKCGNKYSTENFAYTDAFIGKVFYSRVTTDDMKSFNYTYTENINSDFSYDLKEAENKAINSLSEIQNLVGYNLFTTFTLNPSKSNGKLVSFDRISNKGYYNITFAFNLKDIPKVMIDEMKLHSGATEIIYSSCVIEVQISKHTGYIKRVTTKEVYDIQVLGMNLNVQSQSSTLVNNINEEFEFKY